MTTRFHTTNNARWFVDKTLPSTFAIGSERHVLFCRIRDNPGITTPQLQEQWEFKVSMQSRLKEMFDQHYLRLERITDLFSN